MPHCSRPNEQWNFIVFRDVVRGTGGRRRWAGRRKKHISVSAQGFSLSRSLSSDLGSANCILTDITYRKNIINKGKED